MRDLFCQVQNFFFIQFMIHPVRFRENLFFEEFMTFNSDYNFFSEIPPILWSNGTLKMEIHSFASLS